MRQDGSGVHRQGGSLSWRNNHPGNIVYGRFAKNNGAIGNNGRFAVFPDYQTGVGAVESLFDQPTYRKLSLGMAMNRYAPKNENDTDKYLSFIERRTGLNRQKTISELSLNEKRSVVAAISLFEGFKTGDEFSFRKYHLNNQDADKE